MRCSTLISEYLLVILVSLLTLTSFRISSEYNYTRNITTKSEITTKPLKYPLKFNKEDQVIFSIKVKEPPAWLLNCIRQSFLIHHSDELPTFKVRMDFMGFEYGSTVDIIVSPEIIRTDEYLKRLKPSIRECYFEGEKTLKFFKKYTQRNCEVECLTNVTMERCGCVDINQPFNNPYEACLD